MKKSHLYCGAALLGAAALFAGILAAGARESMPITSTTPARKSVPSAGVEKPEVASAWAVKCDKSGGHKQCSMVQELRIKKDNQLVLQVEIRPDGTHAATGVMTLPFGVSVTDGVSFQVDSGPDIRVPFSTCLPQGCLVPLRLGDSLLSALQRGKTLKLTTSVPDSGTVSFEVTLEGFREGYSRMLEQNSASVS